MPAKVEKIRPDLASSPKTILGMLVGHSDKIRHIAAVVVWDDDTYQMVNDVMDKSELAFAVAVMQKALFQELERD